MSEVSALRRRVLGELVAAGFELQGGHLVAPQGEGKAVARSLHGSQRRALLKKSANFIGDVEESVLEFFANGDEVVPHEINPRIARVETPTDVALFRFTALHWSVPVSQGYGRRTRFLIWDDHNGKLIGIFAMGDPVFNLGARDRIIGWSSDDRQKRLYNVFDAFVLGAVDPYRQLIAGKLAAMCTVSDEVVKTLTEKYAGQTTVIAEEIKASRPVLVTTTSALGKSSIYNRLTFNKQLLFQPVGFTSGFGHFQFSDELFDELLHLVRDDDDFRGSAYGKGPNYRIRTIRAALSELGLSSDLLKHGIQREIYLAPLAANYAAYLRGESTVVRPIHRSLAELSDYWRERWAVPRGKRRPEFSAFNRESLRLSSELPLIGVRQQLF